MQNKTQLLSYLGWPYQIIYFVITCIVQVDVDSLRQRTQEIIKENEHLHLRLEQSGSGPADITEW